MAEKKDNKKTEKHDKKRDGSESKESSDKKPRKGIVNQRTIFDELSLKFKHL